MNSINPSYRLGSVSIDPGLVLAPMSGVTTSVFRQLIKDCCGDAVGLTISEFLSVEGMTRGNPRTVAMMRTFPGERPYAIQIFGYDINRMADAALLVQDFGAEIIDINCGCPAPKVVKRGGGCELMRQPEHLAQVVRAVRAAVSIPLTLKMRSGWDSTSRNAVEIAKICEAEGVDGLTVHGRTRVDLYRGFADWEIVRAVAAAVNIPVCGSGDIVDFESASRALCSTSDGAKGIAGLYIGRGAIENPFVFRDILAGPGKTAVRPDGWKVAVLEHYIDLLLESMPLIARAGKVKQLATQMGKGEPWVVPVCRAQNVEQQQEILRHFRTECTFADLVPSRSTVTSTVPGAAPDSPSMGCAA